MKKKLKTILYAIIVAMTIGLDLNLTIETEKIKFSSFYQTRPTTMIIVFGAVLYALYRIKSLKTTKCKNILSAVFSVCMIIGECYLEYSSIFLIGVNAYTITLSIIKLLGYFILFKIGFRLLDNLINKTKFDEIRPQNKFLVKYIGFLTKHPFWGSLITIWTIWAIYIIAFYPMVLSPDPSFQILQYFNIPTKYKDYVILIDPNVLMTAHHPVTQTVMLGKAIEIGRKFVNDNFGLFIYTFVQTIIYSSSLAYTIKFMSKKKVPSGGYIIVLLMYIIVPMYAFYTVSAVKDVLYTAFFIIFVLFLYDVVDEYRIEDLSLSKVIVYFLSITLMSLFRNNGLHVVVLTIPFVLVFLKNNKNRVKIATATCLYLVFTIWFNNIFIPSRGISGTSIREALSIPFQQTARYVKNHEDEITDEEREAIDKILVYDTIADRYNPELSDPVKERFNKYATNEDLKEYFKVWFKEGLNHPLTYVDATLNNIYGFLYPNKNKWYIHYDPDMMITTYEPIEYEVETPIVDYHLNKLEGLRFVLSRYGEVFPFIPLIGLLSNVGFNSWLIFILCAYMIEHKNYKYLIVMIPLILSFVICIVGPANTYFRYTLPYVFLLPTLIVLTIDKITKNKSSYLLEKGDK